MGRLVLGVFAAALVLAAPRAGSAGDANLDRTFGTLGLVTTNVATPKDDSAQALVRQADGKLIAVGYASPGPRYGFTAVRYDANGVLDASYGTAGVAFAEVSTGVIGAAAVLQSDGKLVVAGTVFSGSSNDDKFALARFDGNGQLDASFGSGGVVVTNLNPSHESLYAVALQSDGKLVAAGGTYDVTGQSLVALVRYDTSGVLDATFGTGGIVALQFGNFDFLNDVAVQPDGKIVAVGEAGSEMLLARFEADGDLDGTFASGGGLVDAFGGPFAAGRRLHLQSDGKIVVAGQVGDDLFVARYSDAGSLDAGFGTSGLTVSELGGIIEIPLGVVERSDGRLVVTAEVVHAGDPEPDIDAALVQYTAGGSPDAGFGTGGVVTLSRGAVTVLGDPLLQPDGRLVAAGGTSDADASDYRFLVARFGGDCGNGVTDAGEECDDGNAESDDCCSLACSYDAPGTPCEDDADLCTVGACDGAGACSSAGPVTCSPCRTCDSGLGCIPAPPAASCKQAPSGASKLVLRRVGEPPGSGRIAWSWRRGASVTAPELGNPVTTDDYDLCLYSHQGSPAGALVFDATAPAGSSWSALGAAGYRYRSRTGTPDGLTAVVVRAGAQGRAVVKGDGVNLSAVLPFSAAGLPLRAQLRSENGLCLEAVYSAAGVIQNDGTRFRAASD